METYRFFLSKVTSFFVGLMAAALFAGSLAHGADCLKSLETLEGLEKQQLRDGLFTVATLESSLFTSNLFKDVVQRTIKTTREVPPSEDWGNWELGNLKTKLGRLRENYRNSQKYSDDSEEQKKAKRQKFNDDVKSTKAEIKAHIRKQKFNAAIRKQKLAEDDPHIRYFPSFARFKLARELWEELKLEYILPAAPDVLTLEQTKKIKAHAETWKISYGEFILHHKLVEQIDRDPALKQKALELIADLIRVSQTTDLKKIDKVSAQLKEIGAIDPERYDRPKLVIDSLDSQDLVHFRRLSLDGTNPSYPMAASFELFLTSDHGILFNDIYFRVLYKTILDAGFTPEVFKDNFAAYSLPMKREFSEKVWEALNESYKTENLEGLEYPKLYKISENAIENQLEVDSYFANAYVIKAINEASDPRIKEKTLEMIAESLSQSAEILPHVENAEKWKASNTHGRGAMGGLIGTMTGLVTFEGTAFYLLHHPSHVISSVGVLGLVGSSITAGISSGSAYKHIAKAREWFARRKADNNIKNFKASKNADEHE